MWSPVERELRSAGGPLVAGVDEVGRGPLAGPVVACAVVMPHRDPFIEGIADSKKLNRKKREELASHIKERAVSVGIGAASVAEIDRLNIYHATSLAMRRAIQRLGVVPNHVVIDGRPIKTLGIPHTAIVKGDSVCYSIACASIIAKVTRDRLMTALARRYPHYLWERNAGYGTAAHISALSDQGITAHHRKSFSPVQCLIR